MTYAIYADKFFFEHHIEDAGYILIEAGKFKNYLKEKPEGIKIIDHSGKWIAPGLVDTHIHGIAGADVMDLTEDAILTMSKHLPRTGVTTFLPTTLTAPPDAITKACSHIHEAKGKETGAKIEGIFLEGPYFTEAYKGAQNASYLKEPCLREFQDWQDAAGGLIRKIAIAPETSEAIRFTEQVTQTGVKVALAHSAATFAEAKAACMAGADIFVHTFNGMSPFHHRDIGMVGAAMRLDAVYAELIADGYHVTPEAADILMRLRPKCEMVLVSDAMRAALMPDGVYLLGELEAVVSEGRAKLKNSESLAGSILSLIDGVKNVVDWGIATPHEAINMASVNAARSVGIEDVCGKIEPGYAADFIVLTPELELVTTYIDGAEK